MAGDQDKSGGAVEDGVALINPCTANFAVAKRSRTLAL